MEAVDIKKEIQSFLEFVLDVESKKDALNELIINLYKLVYLVSKIDFKFDENNYPDAPNIKYESLRNYNMH